MSLPEIYVHATNLLELRGVSFGFSLTVTPGKGPTSFSFECPLTATYANSCGISFSLRAGKKLLFLALQCVK